MGLPTMLSVNIVNELFFRHIKELSIRSLLELKEGNKRPELRLIGIGSFNRLGSTSRLFLKN